MISLALERFVSIIHPLYKFQHRSDCDDDDYDDDDDDDDQVRLAQNTKHGKINFDKR